MGLSDAVATICPQAGEILPIYSSETALACIQTFPARIGLDFRTTLFDGWAVEGILDT
jgi:hypothetical protein